MRRSQCLVKFSVLALAACGWLVFVPSAFALRFVQFKISVDDQVVLEASKGDKGEEPDVVWGYLKRLELRPVKGYEIRPDREGGMRATLRGKVRIAAQYGGDVTVDELRIVRDTRDGKWKVDPREVDRTLEIRTRPR